MASPERSPLRCAELDELSSRARARRQAILEAGSALFLEKGYEATSLADVVKLSGGSLATLYELFGSKRGLFEAILVEYAAEIMEPLGAEEVAPNPERGLREVGRRYLASVLEPKVVAWYRMMVHEAASVPELRETFMSAEGGPVQRAVARYLAQLSRAGQLDIDDVDLAASQFLDLVRGRLHRMALAGDERAVEAAEIERHVASAVRVFLYGYAAARRPQRPARRGPSSASASDSPTHRRSK